MTDEAAPRNDDGAPGERTPRAITMEDALAFLRAGEVEVLGRLPWSSNHSFVVRVTAGDMDAVAVYKPARGERPLWDFPHGTLAGREVAAFVISEALGWRIVPPTVLRDGPLGEGMVQLFIEHDPEQHYFALRERTDLDLDDRFREFAAFDVVINNADRKGGHCLLAADGHLWGIDHGVTFHVAPKLRTVIWEYAGRPLGAAVMDALCGLRGALADDSALLATLHGLLATDEVAALRARVEHLAALGAFPHPSTDYPYPWPMV